MENQERQLTFYEKNLQRLIDDIGPANIVIGVMVGTGTGLMVGLLTTALYFKKCKK